MNELGNKEIMMNTAQILLLSLAAFLVASCNSGVELDVTQNAALTAVDQPPFDTDLLCSDISYENEKGKTIKGTRDCSKAKAACKNVGDTDCYIGDKSMYGMDPKDLKAENIKIGVEVGGITGTYVTKDDFCTAEGQADCVATAAFPAALVSDIKTKVVKGQAVGSHQGEMEPDLPDAANVASGHTTGGVGGSFTLCGGATTTNCVVTGAQQTATPASIVAGDIKKGEVVGGVTGTFDSALPNCGANGTQNCVARAGYVALGRSNLKASNLASGYSVLSVGGGVTPRPGDCSADGATGCVGQSRFAAIAKSSLSTGVIRKGVTIGGVVGAYPSTSFPLAGAQSGVTDLSSSSFASAVTTAAPFEFFSRTGERFQVNGSGDIIPAKILTGKNLFGVAGGLTKSPAACTADNETGCVAQATFPAIKKSLLSEGTIRKGVTIAGVAGAYPSAAHPLAGSSGHTVLDYPNNLAGSHSLVFFDAAGTAHVVSAAGDLTTGNVISGAKIFSVTGTATAAPEGCSAHNQLSCVASSSFPSYALSSMDTKVLKKGATFTTTTQTLTGVYPSASAPFEPLGSVKRLTPPDFNSSLRSTDAFEFWDSTGQKHTAHGDANFTGTSFITGANLFGLSGTSDVRPSDCTTGATGCVTTAARPAYDKDVILPGVIKKGTVIGNITGTYPSVSAPLEGALTTMTDLHSTDLNTRLSSNSQFEYFNSAGSRFIAQGDADLAVLTNIRKDTFIFGKKGSTPESASICTTELQTGCVIAGSFKSVDSTKIDAKNIKKGVNIFGETGTYPSVGNPLPDASGMADLTAGTWNTKLRSVAPFEFWDATGTHRTGSGSANITTANLRSGESFYGVSGELTVTKGSCTASGETGCTSTASFPSYKKSALKEEFIRKGATVLGKVGEYPSNDHPLDAGGKPRLANNFNAAMRTNTGYVYWDHNGTRYTATGDNKLAPGNLRDGITIFGVEGTAVPTPNLDPWDVLYGVSYRDAQNQLKSGKIKVKCANGFDSSASIGGGPPTADPKVHTIDDWNNGRSRMPDIDRFSDDAYVCNGDAFEDISYNKTSHAKVSCDPGDGNVSCIYKDRIADLEWLQLDNSSEARTTQSAARTKCANMVAGGHSDWRLPTQKEAMMAYVHGIRSVTLKSNHTNVFKFLSYIWTNTTVSTATSKAYAVEMAQGLLSREEKNQNKGYAHCVRQSRQFP